MRWLIPIVVIGMLTLGLAQLVLVSLLIASATMRYLVDFMPCLLMAAVLAWFSLDHGLADRGHGRLRGLINMAAAVVILYGCVANVAIGMTGYSNDFEDRNPSGYHRLSSLFRWIEPFQMNTALKDFRVQKITLSTPLRAMKAGSIRWVDVTVKNTGIRPWSSVGSKPVVLSYTWFDTRGYLFTRGTKTLLPRELAPGESVHLRAQLMAPGIRGAFLLRWSMLQEHVAWFDQAGGNGLQLYINVE
jgi:hypothetical protein